MDKNLAVKMQKSTGKLPTPKPYFQRIFCPTDLSFESNKGIIYAAALAREYDAKLFVYHCRHGRTGSLSPETRPLSALLSDNFDLSVLEGIEWEGIYDQGRVDKAIFETAVYTDADLIVMHSRRGPIRHALLGSTAETVVASAPCPILILHTDERDCIDENSGLPALKRILIADDFSDQGNLALAYGQILAKEFHAEIDLLHILPQTTDSSLLFPRTGELAAARAEMMALVPEEISNYCKINYQAVEGVPYSTIIHQALDRDIDLICIGAHSARLGHWEPFGSTASWVLRNAPCPVLIARPKI